MISGPLVRAIVRFKAAASSLKDVRGIGAAITFKPRSSSGRTIACQLEPSAHAPWTTTTVAFSEKLIMLTLSGNSKWKIRKRVCGVASGEELYDLLRNEFARIFERKVAGIEQVELRFWNISEVGLRTLDGEEGIVFSPHDQRLRLLASKEFMPPVIKREMRLVGVKQAELDVVVAGPIKEEL